MLFNNLFLRGACTVVFLLLLSSVLLSQAGNTVSGFVFDQRRQPVADVTVELMDDYSRSIGRTRTTSSGRYFFNRVPSGRFRVRVQPSGTDFAEQEQDVEIQNIRREVGGSVFTSAIENAQRDFYLRPRKVGNTGRSEVIFAQEVPAGAKELYIKGISQLEAKDEAQGLTNIKAAIESFPDYFDAIEKLGTEYIRLKHFEAAEILLARATEINSRSFNGWYGLAYALNSQNKVGRALEAVQKALALNQNSVEAHFLGGAIERRAGNFAASEKQLKKALEMAGDSVPEIHWQLALLYGNNLKRYKEAAEQLETYLKKSPDLKDKETVRRLIEQFRSKSQETGRK